MGSFTLLTVLWLAVGNFPAAGSRPTAGGGATIGDPTVAGHVYGPDGKPVSGATVWLAVTGYSDKTPQKFQATTGEAGVFEFPAPPSDELFAERKLCWVIVRDAQRRLGWHGYLGQAEAASLRIKLLEIGEYYGRLTNAEGKPVAQAEVAVISLAYESFRVPNRNGVNLISEFAEPWKVKSDSDGKFTLKGIPTTGSLWALINATGYAPLSVQWNLNEPVTIVVQRGSPVRGKFDFDGPPPGPDLISLGCAPAESLRETPDTPYLAHAAGASKVVAKADGTFETEALPPGRYRIWSNVTEAAAFYADPSEPFEVKEGEAATNIVITLHRGVAVRGRVVDGQTGKGVEKATVFISWLNDADTISLSRNVTTDADGKYVGYVKPGHVIVRVKDLPVEYLPPRETDWRFRLDAKQDAEWPTIELVRATTVAGIVVDEAGKPVSDAEVRVNVPENQFFEPYARKAALRSGADGRFDVLQLDPTDSIPFRARTATATTDGKIVVVPEKLTEPVRLVVSEKFAFRARGRVVDTAGRPIASAQAVITWGAQHVTRYGQQGMGFGIPLKPLRTNQDGSFESEALWPGDYYQARILAEGFARGETSRVDGVAGKTEDWGTITLTSSGRVVTGRVVDSAGQPLGGARVLNRGDGVNEVITQTDADGQFKLTGLLDGAAYVCANKEGYRFTGQRVPRDSGNVTITLFKPDEPRPTTQATSPEQSYEADRALARHFLQWIWTQPGMNAGRNAQSLIGYMARIDPNTAMKWSAELGGRYDYDIKLNLANKMARQDADKTLELLAEQSNDRAVRALRGCIRRLEGSSPEKALRYAEEAVVRARALEQPARSAEFARLGTILLALGRQEVGRKLIEDAADAVDKLGGDGLDTFYRGTAAQALAPLDLERALKLLEPITQGTTRDHYAARIALSFAPADSAKALGLLERISSQSLPEQHKVAIAYYAARRDGTEAVKIAASTIQPEYRALALGWVAVVVAPRDRALACELIDRAFATVRDDRESGLSWAHYGGCGPLTARLAVQARQISYPDVESLVWQVIATRAPQAQSWRIKDQIDGHARTAAILGLVDRALARQLLEDLEPRRAQLADSLDALDRNGWLVAWAVADPPHACDLVRENILNRRSEPGQQESDTDLWNLGVSGVLDVLTRSPDERHQKSCAIFLNLPFWFPDQEE